MIGWVKRWSTQSKVNPAHRLYANRQRVSAFAVSVSWRGSPLVGIRGEPGSHQGPAPARVDLPASALDSEYTCRAYKWLFIAVALGSVDAADDLVRVTMKLDPDEADQAYELAECWFEGKIRQ